MSRVRNFADSDTWIFEREGDTLTARPTISDDEAFAAFWDRIECSYGGWISPAYHTPDEQVSLRALCQQREVAGREEFGDAWRYRDNLAELAEEVSDAMNYLMMEARQDEENDVDPEWDVVLEIADHLLAVQRLLPILNRKHKGAPA